MVVVHRAARLGQEEAAPAAPDSRARRPSSAPAVERGAAVRAACCGRPAACPRRSPPRAARRRPRSAISASAGRRARGCARPARRCEHRQRHAADPASLLLHHALDVHARRGRAPPPRAPAAPPARASRTTPGTTCSCPRRRSWAMPVLDPEQLDVAAVRLHVRPHAVERLPAPAPRSAPGSRSWISSRLGDELVRRPARSRAVVRVGDQLDDPLQARRRTSARPPR